MVTLNCCFFRFFSQNCQKVKITNLTNHFVPPKQKFLPIGGGGVLGSAEISDPQNFSMHTKTFFVVVPFLVAEIDMGEVREPERVRHYVRLPMQKFLYFLGLLGQMTKLLIKMQKFRWAKA